MSNEHSRDDQEFVLHVLIVEVERECERVGVDWTVAAPRLLAAAPGHERVASDGDSEVLLGLDVTGLLRTLRSLPTQAGTAEFVAALTADRSEFDPPPV